MRGSARSAARAASLLPDRRPRPRASRFGGRAPPLWRPEPAPVSRGRAAALPAPRPRRSTPPVPGFRRLPSFWRSPERSSRRRAPLRPSAARRPLRSAGRRPPPSSGPSKGHEPVWSFARTGAGNTGRTVMPHLPGPRERSNFSPAREREIRIGPRSDSSASSSAKAKGEVMPPSGCFSTRGFFRADPMPGKEDVSDEDPRPFTRLLLSDALDDDAGRGRRALAGRRLRSSKEVTGRRPG